MAEMNKAYAAALFALGQDSGTSQALSEGVKLLTRVFSEYPEYVELLSSPALPSSERETLVREAFDGRIPADLVSFLLLICQGGHLGEWDACAEEFEELYQESLRSATATVRSAVELTEEETSRLRARLEALSGKTVTLACSVDPSLLGGIVAELDGTVYDGSLRRRMDQIKKVMDE